MFFKLGSFVYKSRVAILIAWGVLVVVMGSFAPRATEVLKAGGFNLPNAESIKVGEEIAARFGGSRSYLFAVVTAPQGTPADDPAFAKSVEEAVAPLRTYQYSKQIITFASSGAKDLVSPDRRYTYALLGLNLNYDEAQGKLKEINGLIKKGSLDLKLAGLPVVYEAFSTVSQNDAEKAELFALPIALLVLLLVFRTAVAAAMPLMMAVVSVVITLGLVFFIGQAADLSIFVLNISTLLGLGVGIDYALFFVSRFREELYKQNGDVRGAVMTAMGTSGKAVFFSGLTVMVGLASLLLSQFSMLRSIGVGGMVVVGVSVLAALTLLPATLAVLGTRINRWRVPGLRPVEAQLTRQQMVTGFWHSLAERVSRRPILVSLGVLVFLLFIGSPFLHVRFGSPSYQVLPADEPSRQGAEILDRNFPNYGRNSDIYIIAKAKTGQMTDPANSMALYDYATAVKANFPQIQKILAGGQDLLAQPKAQLQQGLQAYAANSPLVSQEIKTYLATVVNGNAATLKFLTNLDYSSKEAGTFIKDLRAFQPAGLDVAVGGEQAGLVDFVSVLYSDFPVAIGVVVILTYIILFVMFQSVVLPLKAVIMTGLSLSASYGALVWIFQDGMLTELLGTQRLGYVEATLPILLFAILFGLSMDYEVFMLSRIKEQYDETGNNSKSVATGLERTGSMITSAALLMVIVAGAFGTASIVVIKAVGIGMALAVALDATIVRALLVPATMELLGKANWWAPRFIRKFLPKLSVE